MLATQARLIEDNGNLLLTLLSPNGSSICVRMPLDAADQLADELARQVRAARDAPMSNEAA